MHPNASNNLFTGRPDIVDVGQMLLKLREESRNLPPLPFGSEQLRVYVRFFPIGMADDQVDKMYKIDDGKRLHVSVTNAGATAEHELRFSHVFSCKATQQEIFSRAARPLVFNFISGDNVLIFAYGCTSSGKTFTIEGTRDNPGVLPRCLQTMFHRLNVVEQHRLQPVRFNEFNVLSSRQAEAAAADKAALFAKIHVKVKNFHFDQGPSTSDVQQQAGRQCSLFMGFVEVYSNNIYDLLAPSMQSSENQPLNPKNSKQPNQRPQPKLVGKNKQPLEPREALEVGEDILHNTYVKGLRWIQVRNVKEALELVAFARRNSSRRSHMICFVRVAFGEKGPFEVEKASVMVICDLAGSERPSTIGHQGDQLREACNINTDLLTLGQCLTGMQKNQFERRKLQMKQNPTAGAAEVVAKKKPNDEPVYYRSCRLTYLLKAFIVGGRARVAMISTIVPTIELFEQNINVLRYSAFASEVVVYRNLKQAVIEEEEESGSSDSDDGSEEENDKTDEDNVQPCVEPLKERISKLQVVYEELNSSRHGNENESKMFNEQIEGLRSELKSKERELNTARFDYTGKVQQFENVKLQLVATQQRMAEIDKERQQLLEEARAREDLGNTTDRLQELQFIIDEVTIEHETVQTHNRTLEETSRKQVSRIQELECGMEQKSNKIASLQNRIDELQRTINENNKERYYSSQIVQKLEIALASTREELQQKVAEVESLNTAIASRETLLADLRENKQNDDQINATKLKELELAYENAQSELAEKSSRASTLDTRVTELKGMVRKLNELANEKALFDLSSTLQEKIVNLERMADRLKEIEPSYEKSLSDLAAKSSEVASLSKASDLENTLKEQSDRLATITGELERLTVEKDSLLSKLEAEKAALEEAKRVEVASYSSKITELETKIRSKTADYDHLSNRFASVEAELIDARQEIDRCRAEFDAKRSILTKPCEDDAKALLDAKMLAISKLELRLDDAEKTIGNQRLQIIEQAQQYASKITELENSLAKQKAENATKEAELPKHCATFASQVSRAMEQTIKTNQESLNIAQQKLFVSSERIFKYQTLVCQLKQILEDRNNQQVGSLEDRIKSLTEHRDAMEEALNGRIRGLEAEVRDKDEEISVLRKDLDAARDKEERSLRLAYEKDQEAAGLRVQVETLNDRLSTSNKLQEMQDSLGQKDVTYESLTEELENEKNSRAQLKMKIQELEQSLDIQRQEDKKGTTALAKVARELSEKKDVVVQKNSRIAELEQEVLWLSGDVERLESVLATKEAQISKMVVGTVTNHPDEVENAANSAPGRAGRGGGKRMGKRKQESPVEHEKEPSDSEIDALVTAQMQVVESGGAVQPTAEEQTNKKRRRVDEPPTEPPGSKVAP